jgi:hypothetical protein
MSADEHPVESGWRPLTRRALGPTVAPSDRTLACFVVLSRDEAAGSLLSRRP